MEGRKIHDLKEFGYSEYVCWTGGGGRSNKCVDSRWRKYRTNRCVGAGGRSCWDTSRSGCS